MGCSFPLCIHGRDSGRIITVSGHVPRMGKGSRPAVHRGVKRKQMAKPSKGWIKLSRDITDHWLWQEKPFDKKSAWIDLILMANHKDKTIFFSGAPLLIKRGQLVTSEKKLSERWGWSRNKTRAFLGQLKVQGMILAEGTAKGTTLTLVNYDNFQGRGPAEGTAKGTAEGTADGTQTRMYKNDKNGKNRARVQIEQHDYNFDEIDRQLAILQTKEAEDYEQRNMG